MKPEETWVNFNQADPAGMSAAIDMLDEQKWSRSVEKLLRFVLALRNGTAAEDVRRTNHATGSREWSWAPIPRCDDPNIVLSSKLGAFEASTSTLEHPVFFWKLTIDILHVSSRLNAVYASINLSSARPFKRVFTYNTENRGAEGAGAAAVYSYNYATIRTDFLGARTLDTADDTWCQLLDEYIL